MKEDTERLSEPEEPEVDKVLSKPCLLIIAGLTELMNSQQLWVPAQDLQNIKPANIPVWTWESLIILHTNFHLPSLLLFLVIHQYRESILTSLKTDFSMEPKVILLSYFNFLLPF